MVNGRRIEEGTTCCHSEESASGGRRRISKSREACSVKRTWGIIKFPLLAGNLEDSATDFSYFPSSGGGGINRALNSHRTYKCFPLTLTLSLKGEGTILYILVYRLPNIPLSALRCTLHAFRSTLHEFRDSSLRSE